MAATMWEVEALRREEPLVLNGYDVTEAKHRSELYKNDPLTTSLPELMSVRHHLRVPEQKVTLC